MVHSAGAAVRAWAEDDEPAWHKEDGEGSPGIAVDGEEGRGGDGCGVPAVGTAPAI
jgi:hypothetical protein